MATGAGRHALGELAATEQRLATLDQLGIGGADAHLLTGKVGGDISHVLVAEVVQNTGHLQYGALAALDVMQLLQQVALALAGQLGEVRRGAVAVGAMAGTADGDLGLAGFGIADDLASVGGLRCHGDTQAQQETHEYFVHQLIQ